MEANTLATKTFIGRTRETAILTDAVHDVMAGQGRLVLLHGEPGIGKTRLAEETARSAAAQGACVLWGRCWEAGGAPAFWLWIQLIRGSVAAGAWSDTMLAEAQPGLTLIAQMVPELRPSLPLPEPIIAAVALPVADASRRPGPERFVLFDAITNLFKGLASRTPLMMVLDDLHAADADSLLLLRFLARELKQTRILIVATYRELEVRQSAEHAALLSDIGREGTPVPLRGLSLDEVGDFVRSGGDIAADPETVFSLRQATGGNPFFLDEIVRLMIAEREHGGRVRPRAGFTIPDSIRAAIDRRIQPLSDRTKSLLTLASVIGNEFDFGLLSQAAELPRPQLLESLAEAAANAIIVEPAQRTEPYRFAHATVAETLRGGLGLTARALLHQQVAMAVERLHQRDLAPHFARLAHHYVEALSIGDPGKAVEYSRRGAERARRQLAFAEAVRLYGMALDAFDAAAHPDEAQRCETLLAMGEAQAQGGGLDEARRAFEEAAEVARRLDDATPLAQAALHASAWFGSFFNVDHALTHLVEEALRALSDGDSAMRAALMATLASERYWAGNRESGIALSDEAVAMARRVGDPRALVAALWVASQLRWGPEDVEGRLASATEIASLAESIGDYPRALRAQEMRFTALLEMGDMPGLEAEVRAYEALARRAGEDFGIVERFDAALALLKGAFERAARQVQVLAKHAERRQDPALLVCVQALSAELWDESGSFVSPQSGPAAHALLAQSTPLAAQYRVISALLHVAGGQRVEAAAELESLAWDNCAAIPRDWNWLDNMRSLSIVSVALRDSERAAIVYELLRPYATRNITAGWGDVARGCAALYLGSLARLLGRLDDAEAHFELALERNRRMGARPALARTQFEYGRMALSRNRAGDREKALPLLRAALATAKALGMAPLERRARAVFAKLGESADESVAPPAAGTAIDAIAESAIAEPSAVYMQAASDGTLTILFSDIEGSTTLFDSLGDLRAQDILNAHNAIIREHVARNRGVVVKSTGDGFMMVFSSARRAILCAMEIQRALAAFSQTAGNTPIRVRMGLHVGEPLTVTNDLAGKAVIIAARIAAVARGGEILVSSTLRELTEAAGDLRFTDAGEVTLKGISGTHRIYRVMW